MNALRAFVATLAAAASTWGVAHDGHHHPAQQDEGPGFARTTARYRVPDATLQRADGTLARFPQEIDAGGPVVLNFIYTSCTAVCPILSQSFAQFQRELGAGRDKIRFVSISIDPEEDTPERLSAYAKHFDAGPHWRFYTGSYEASVRMQKAFHAYFGDKMHHRPMTFMRAAPGAAWVRLEGFATPQDLLQEYRRLVAQ